MTVVNINKMYPPEIGGVEVVTEAIAKIVAEHGFKSKVLTFNSERHLKIEHLNNIEVWRIPVNIKIDPVRISLFYAKYFKNIINDADKLIFHFPSFQPELNFLLHQRYINKTKICFFHAEVSGRGLVGHFYNHFLTDKFLNKMEKIIVTSPMMIESNDVLKKYKHKIEIIPLFVDTEHFFYRPQNKRSVIIESLNFKHRNPKIVLYVGRFGRYKGLEYLVKAFAKLPNNYVLVMIGKGPKKPFVKKLCEKLMIQDRVLFLENIPYSDLPEFYSAADVFVLPSTDRGEAFGIVVLEAMACGIPVITTELGTGTTYHNLNKVTGLHVKPRDVEGISNAIKLITTENWKQTKKDEIVSRSKEFDLKIFKKRIIELLEST
ncbi:MAG: glycosyltransferase [Fervidobacterium sp.]|nr:glycosyltransferase [Fervidobacterium sp.]